MAATQNRFYKFWLAVIICQGAGVFGSLFSEPKIDPWYANLTRPSYAPPDWVFAPVWITLFLLMGIALYLVWLRCPGNDRVRQACGLFLVHLLANIAWTAIFFGMQQMGWALIEIIFLIGMIATVTVWFWRIDRRAGYLMIPYLLWVCFAAVLNYGFWQLNR